MPDQMICEGVSRGCKRRQANGEPCADGIPHQRREACDDICPSIFVRDGGIPGSRCVPVPAPGQPDMHPGERAFRDLLERWKDDPEFIAAGRELLAEAPPVQPDSLREAVELVRHIRAKGKVQSERVCYNGQIQRKYTWSLTEGEAARDIMIYAMMIADNARKEVHP